MLRNLDQPMDDTINQLVTVEQAATWDTASEAFVTRLDFAAIEAANQPIQRRPMR